VSFAFSLGWVQTPPTRTRLAMTFGCAATNAYELNDQLAGVEDPRAS
jgi:hypothetical protein